VISNNQTSGGNWTSKNKTPWEEGIPNSHDGIWPYTRPTPMLFSLAKVNTQIFEAKHLVHPTSAEGDLKFPHYNFMMSHGSWLATNVSFLNQSNHW